MFTKSILYVLSILFFSYIETTVPIIYSVESVPLIHHVITSSISNYMLYNNSQYILNIFEQPQETQSPLVLYFPVFSCAYGLYDLYNVIRNKKSLDFILPGVLFSTLGLIFMYYENFHWIYSGLLMETSSVFLLFIRKPSNTIRYCFAISFFFYRNIVFPYISFLFLKKNYMLLIEPEHFQEKGLMVFLYFINSLNFYWGYKIANKLIRHIKNE